MLKKAGILKKDRDTLIACAIIVSFLIVLSCCLLIQDNNKALLENRDKLIKTVYIEQGDTLWDIAKDNLTGEYTIKTLVEEICQINNLEDPNTIHEGRYILVPYYEEE